MTGIDSLKALLDGKAIRVRRKYDDDMYITLDEHGQLSLSEGYDYYIEREFSFDIKYGSPGYAIEYFYNDLLKDDWEVVE
jgi:hypothetical protein